MNSDKFKPFNMFNQMKMATNLSFLYCMLMLEFYKKALHIIFYLAFMGCFLLPTQIWVG